jgi:hypothetical protein
VVNVLAKQLKQKYAGRPTDLIWENIGRIACLVHLTFFTVLLLWLPTIALFFMGPIWSLVAMVVMVWLLAITITIVRCYYQENDCGDGVPLTRDDCPELFEVIDEVSKQFDGLGPVQVRLTTDASAGALTTRNWRHQFRWTYELRLGVCMLLLASREDLKGTIAHEFYHFQECSKKIGLRGCFCGNSLVRIAQGAVWNAQFFPLLFFRGILHRLHREMWAHKVLLHHRVELEADAASVQACSPRSSAASMVRAVVLLRKFKQEGPLGKAFVECLTPTPPDNFVQLTQAFFQEALADTSWVPQAVEKAFARVAHPLGTHPSLAERVSAMGIRDQASQEQLIEEAFKSTEPFLISVVPRESIDRLNSIFEHENKDRWKSMFSYLEKLKQRLVPLEDATTKDQAWDRFYLADHQRDDAAAIGALEKVLQFSPNNKIAAARLAIKKLHFGDTTVVPDLKAMFTSPSHEIAEWACAELATHFEKSGDAKSLFEVAKFNEKFAARSVKVHIEKHAFSWWTKFRNAKLTQLQIAQINLAMSKYSFVGNVYVVGKRLKNCHSTRFLVVSVGLKQWSFSSDRRKALLQKELKDIINDEFQLIFDSPVSLICKRIRNTDGALVRKAGGDPSDQASDCLQDS